MQPETYFIVAPLDDHNHDGDVLKPVKVFSNTEWVSTLKKDFDGKKNLQIWVKQGGEAPKVIQEALSISELNTAQYCGQFIQMAGTWVFYRMDDCPTELSNAVGRPKRLDSKPGEVGRIELKAQEKPIQKLVPLLEEQAELLSMLTKTDNNMYRLNLPEGIPKATYLMLPDKESKPIWQRLADLKLPIDLDFVELFYFEESEGGLALVKLVLEYSQDFKNKRAEMRARVEADRVRIEQDQGYLENWLRDAVKDKEAFNTFFLPKRITTINDCSNIQEAAAETLCELVLNKHADLSVASLPAYIEKEWLERSGELLATWEHRKTLIEAEEASAKIVRQHEREAENAAIAANEPAGDVGGFEEGPEDGFDEETQRAIAVAAAADDPQPLPGRQNGRHGQGHQPMARPDQEARAVEQALAASLLEPQGIPGGEAEDDPEMQQAVAASLEPQGIPGGAAEDELNDPEMQEAVAASLEPQGIPGGETEDDPAMQKAVADSLEEQRRDRNAEVKKRHQKKGPQPNQATNAPPQNPAAERMRLAAERFRQEQDAERPREGWAVGPGGEVQEHNFQAPGGRARNVDNVDEFDIARERAKTPRVKFLPNLRLRSIARMWSSRRNAEDIPSSDSDIRPRCKELADKLESLDMSDVTVGVRSRPTGFTQMIGDLRRFAKSRTEPQEAEVVAQLRARAKDRKPIPVDGQTHRDPEITEGFYVLLRSKTTTKTLDDVAAAIDSVESKLQARGPK